MKLSTLICSAAVFGISGIARAQQCAEPGLAIGRAVSNGVGLLRVVGTSSWQTCREITNGPSPAAGVRYGPNGNIFVWVQSSGPLLEYDGQSGAFVRTVIPSGASGSTGLLQGRGFTFMPSGDILVVGGDKHNVVRFSGASGSFVADFVPPGSGGLGTTRSAIYGPNGNLYVTSAGTAEIIEYNGTTGAFVKIFVARNSGGIQSPYDLTFGPNGDLFVSDVNTGHVYRYDGGTGASLGVFSQTPIPPMRGIAFGSNGDLYACSWGGPLGGGVYRYDWKTGALVGQVVSDYAAMFCAFQKCEPPIATSPVSGSACRGSAATFSVAAAGTGPLFYRWQVEIAPPGSGNWTDLFDGPIFGSTAVATNSSTRVLSISKVDFPAARRYRCNVSNACGSVTSNAAALAIGGPTCCPSDLNGDSIVDDSDFTAFVVAYQMLLCDDPSMPEGCPCDLNGDTLVDDSDFQLFGHAYDALLCP